jgi:amino acid transporter
MMNWELLWKILLVFTLVGYSLLVIVVIFGGVGNIADMLRDLRKPPEQD